MSTAAAATNKPQGNAGYEVARPLGKCHVTGETIAPGDAVVLTTTGGRTRVTRAPRPLPLAPRS